MSLVYVHDRLANAMLLFTFIAGVWGLVRYAAKHPVGGNYWGVLAAGELLFFVQGALGATLFLTGARPAQSIHILYGVVAVVTLPIYYGISHGRDDRRAVLVYGLLCLFLTGVTLRAIMTAG
jgi:hypothetical protein